MIHSSRAIETQITLNFRAKKPLGEQIYGQLLQLILEKQLLAEDQLPPVRDLAASLKVNFNTVARAYRMLDKAGFISTQQGRGTYVLEGPGETQPKESFVKEDFVKRISTLINTEAERTGNNPAEIWGILHNQKQETGGRLLRLSPKRISRKPGWKPSHIPQLPEMKTRLKKYRRLD
jgi:GntR family transcriptional regulator